MWSHEVVLVESGLDLRVVDVLALELGEDRVEIELKASNGVLKLEGFEDVRVEGAQVADGMAVHLNASSTAGHPSGVVVVSRKREGLLFVFAESNGARLLHDLVKNALNDFNVSTVVEHHAANLADVASTSLTSRVEHAAVADFENFLGNRLFSVLLEGHEESRDHGGTDHLVLKSLGVSQSDALVIVDGETETDVVVFLRDQATGQALNVPGLSTFMTEQVLEFVGRLE